MWCYPTVSQSWLFKNLVDLNPDPYPFPFPGNLALDLRRGTVTSSFTSSYQFFMYTSTWLWSYTCTFSFNLASSLSGLLWYFPYFESCLALLYCKVILLSIFSSNLEVPHALHCFICSMLHISIMVWALMVFPFHVCLTKWTLQLCNTLKQRS